MAKTSSKSIRFDQKLILNQWILSLFEVSDFESLAAPLKPLEYEGLDENNVHHFHHQLKLLWPHAAFGADELLGYDENIVKHTLQLSSKRSFDLKWKYFQYLSLLFTEIYLDRFFRNPVQLLADLNTQLEEFNSKAGKKDQLPPFVSDDLCKIAFWNATGSGKTLLMHVNIPQYLHYQKLFGTKRKLDRIILLTPNEGLSNQHLEEFQASGIDAQIFSKEGKSLFSGKSIEIIDIHKLKEDMGEKTVAIDSFEGNNLVLVDEGHRGASSGKGGQWMDARDRLCESGFSFEYSATFGQALKKGSELEQQYAKNILFDYSYKYFYRDGFGKDYRILNLADDTDRNKRRLYLTACLVAFYQQQKMFADEPQEFRPFLLERPLWVFVGGSVNAVRTQKGKSVSDVIDILLTLAEFVKDKRESIDILDRLLSGKPGLLDQGNREIFATAFPYLVQTGMDGQALYQDILKVVFNSSTQAALHVELLKGADGEIALRVGENDAFGLINVGDASKLCKLCDKFPELVVKEKIFSGSLFRGLNEDESTVNVLIGSKKFTEGWNSWRVSTMGLMNMAKSEGSEIIQLFGRGVRLKGKDLTLKRSSALDLAKKPENIKLLETLNIFGVKASYMQQFKEYLEEEGLPNNEEPLEFFLKVVPTLNGKKLTAIRLKDGMDFKKHGPKPELADPPEKILKHPVTVNWYPKIQARQSKGVKKSDDVGVKSEGQFENDHIAFMDLNRIWFDLQRFKNERAWYNISIPKEAIEPLLRNADWYKLFIPPEELVFKNFEQVGQWEEIAIAMLKKYVDRFYKFKKQEWESEFYEYHELSPSDPNFIDEYKFLIDESQQSIVDQLQVIQSDLESGIFKDWSFGSGSAMSFDQHLYQPLIHVKSDMIKVSPTSLNEGEKNFVIDVRSFHSENKSFFEGKEMYLLRNRSRGRGIGFFEAGNFYPDFIVWILDGTNQYVTFVDPKGLRNLEGPNDPKIRFYKTIKELEQRLADPNVVLNSFIVSNTPFQQISWWSDDLTKQELGESHVLFQIEDRKTYIQKLLSVATSDSQVTVEA